MDNPLLSLEAVLMSCSHSQVSSVPFREPGSTHTFSFSLSCSLPICLHLFFLALETPGASMTGTKQSHVVSRLLKRSYNKKAGECSTSTLQSCQWIDTFLPFSSLSSHCMTEKHYSSGSRLSCLISYLSSLISSIPHADLLHHSILRRLRLATLMKLVVTSVRFFTSLFCLLRLSLLVLYFPVFHIAHKSLADL